MVRCTDRGPRYLLILDGHRNWGFPKGHVEQGEKPEEAAVREIAEETGLGVQLHELLGTIDWAFRHRGRRIHKSCVLYLATSPSGDPVPQADEGITACAWVPFADATKRLAFENAREILARAHGKVGPLCGNGG